MENWPDAQDRAVSHSAGTKRSYRPVAETSITIDGVSLVIDGGLARIARYDARRGINSLLVEPISRAAAEQRRGRAGRTGPGTCMRLWSEAEHAARPERETAEVQRVDLSETLLMLAAVGIRDPEAYPWFERPDERSVSRASGLLQDLGALDAAGRMTGLGRQMARFPLHPRYARLLIEGAKQGVLEEVTLIAAASQGRPFYRAAREERVRRAQVQQIEDQVDARSDCFVLLQAWDIACDARFNAASCAALGIHGAAARQAGQVAQQLRQVVERQGLQNQPCMDRAAALCKSLLAAFSDHLSLRADGGTRRCRMVHGRSAELRRESLVDAPLLVAIEIEERQLRGEVSVLLGVATAVEPAWLEELFPEDFSEGADTVYDPKSRRVEARTERCFRDLVLSTTDSGHPDAARAAELLAAEVAAGRLLLKNWNAAVESWIQRVNFVARYCPETEIAPIDAEARQLILEQICQGAFSYKEIKDRPVLEEVRQWISPEQQYYIDTYAPAEIELPRRKRPAKVRYESDGRAFIASKLQDFYDVSGRTLTVANGQVALLVELLAPNGRPAHLTDDLDGFWEGAYAHVRKDLAGRYPKHEWR